ncbi:ATP-binding protein [Halomonas sp. 25-S5]|uniref:ATP-binding protein n=1 Tax=Halomonas sp. 25-S5 TaxID=2994065 RepID=UPI0024689894|nr:ATP-binding protein [Halomonas sp. 25-S5]
MGQLELTTGRYRSLRLGAIADDLIDLLARAEANEASYLTFADMLVEHERQRRDAKRIGLYRRQAGFPSDKRLEAFDYRHQTTITKRQVNALLDFAFLDNHENLVFIGPPGVGKTHLAIGIGQKAIEAGYRVTFRNALDLVEELELAEMKGELKKKLHQLTKADALVIDIC